MKSIPFLKNILPKKSVEELKLKSRLDYVSATERNNKLSLGFRLRLANRAKVNLEKTFLDGAELTEKYESLKNIPRCTNHGSLSFLEASFMDTS